MREPRIGSAQPRLERQESGRCRGYDGSHDHLRANDPLQRHPPRDRADADRPVRRLLRHVRRRLALRATRGERDRPLRRAHVLQGDGAATDGARHRHGDRRDRRRVQRVHRQGGDRVLRQVRGRDARRRARRPRRHAAQLAVRRGRDRAREGRDRRGDEHVQRHAAQLHRQRLGAARVRRPAARLGHHRQRGDRPRRDARDLHGVHRPLVPARADGRRTRREHRRRPRRAARGAARRPARPADADARAGRPPRPRLARPDPHEGLRPGAPRDRRACVPDGTPRPLRAPAPLHRARWRDVLPALHRGPGASRARLLRLLGRDRVLRCGDAGGSGGRRPQPHRRRRLDDRGGAADDRPRARSRDRAREGAVVREGTVRARTREPSRDDHVRAATGGARGMRDRARRGARRARRGHGRGRPARRRRRCSAAICGWP